MEEFNFKAESEAFINRSNSPFKEQSLEEPNCEMRTVAESELQKYTNFVSVNGSAENATLKDKSVNLIVVAQAFHWFDKVAFKKECERIIDENNRIALLWNRKDTEQDIIRTTNEVYKKYCRDYKARSGGELAKVEKEIGEFFDIYEKLTFENNLLLDKASFVAMNLSQSYSPTINSPNYNSFVEEIKHIFEKYQQNGKVIIKNTTYLYHKATMIYGCK